MLQQFLYGLLCLLVAPFLPVFYFVGKRLRKKIPSLGEAESGKTGQIRPNPVESHVLFLGESTIAGVGVQDHSEGIAGHFSRLFCEKKQKNVAWLVLARNGYTAEHVHKKLVPRIPTDIQFEVVILGMGGNDTFRFNAPLTFRKNMMLSIEGIRERQPAALILLANMPPVGSFPAFPRVFQWVLGTLVQLHGAVIQDLPSKYPNVRYASESLSFDSWKHRLDPNIKVHDLFSDGVHPSALTYRLWAEELVRMV